MPNAPHILETALLLLAAFLIGSVVGYGLRRLAISKPWAAKTRSAGAAAAAPAAPAAESPLVVAPSIAPIAAAPKPTAAQRLAAASAGPATEPEAVAEPGPETIQPARVAGKTTSGRIVPSPVERPVAPYVAPELPETPVVAADVPPIDEAVHVLDPDQAPTPAPEPELPATVEPELSAPAAQEPGPVAPAAAAPVEISWSELSGTPEAVFRSRLEAESEEAAMRAVEGGWTPRPAMRSAPRPVELLEPIRDVAAPEPSPAPEPVATPEPAAPASEGASAAEIAGALSAARTAVEAATAAAGAALAEVARPAPGVVETVAAADEPSEPQAGGVGSDVRGHAPFGRPAGLAGPRDGGKDDLLQIRGLTSQSEAALNAIGIFHFDQIAAWDKKAALWVDNHLALKGSLARDKWVEQARELSRGPGFRVATRR